MIAHVEYHQICGLLPSIPEDEFSELVADIKAHGLLEPITLHEGKILDGRHRYRACVQAGIEPVFREFANGNPVDYVLSVNLHRRHLRQGQKAIIVAIAQDWAKANLHGGYRASRTNAAEKPLINQSSDQVVILPLDSVADRAAQSGVSGKTQRQADKVAKTDQDLAKAVANGEISLTDAVDQINHSPPKPPKQKRLSEEESAALLAENEQLREAAASVTKDAREAIEDNENMARIFDADDRLAAAMKEIGRMQAEIRVLRERLNGKMNECVELNRLLKACRAARERLEKASGK